jgi:hypothetical protein
MNIIGIVVNYYDLYDEYTMLYQQI